MRADRRIEQRTRGQTDHPDEARERKADACGLATGLRVVRLVLSGVSGIEIPVPSTSLTVRPRQRQRAFARALTSRPVACVSAATIGTGKRCRALQYAPVRML
jgi:hypothetical protein